MMYDYALVALYNLIFTSLPIIFLGIWDQDVNAEVSQLYPELYRMGLRNDKFTVWQFELTVLDAIFQSSVCFFFPYMILLGGSPDPTGRDQNGMYELGTIIASIAVFVANFFVMFSIFSFTWIQIFIIAISILVTYAFICVYSAFNSFVFAGQARLFGTGFYWLLLILTVTACFTPRFCAKHYIHQYHPYDNDIVREQELVLHNGRSQRQKLHNNTETNSDKTKRSSSNDEGIKTSSKQYNNSSSSSVREETQPDHTSPNSIA
jgi:phospholipid-translocating ATPase